MCEGARKAIWYGLFPVSGNGFLRGGELSMGLTIETRNPRTTSSILTPPIRFTIFRDYGCRMLVGRLRYRKKIVMRGNRFPIIFACIFIEGDIIE